MALILPHVSLGQDVPTFLEVGGYDGWYLLPPDAIERTMEFHRPR